MELGWMTLATLALFARRQAVHPGESPIVQGRSALYLKTHPIGRVSDVLWIWFWKDLVTLCMMLIGMCRQLQASCFVVGKSNDLLGFTNSANMGI